MRFFVNSFFLLATILCFSQNSKLSKEEFIFLQDKTRAFFNSNIDSSFFYANKIEKSENVIHRAFAFGAKGYLFSDSGNFDKANYYFNKAVKLIKTAPNSYLRSQNEAYIYNYGGLINWKIGKFPKALDYYFFAKKISESINDVVQIVKINNNIALITNDAGNYQKAISITKQSEKIIESNKDLYSESQYLANKSNVNINLGVYYEKYFSHNKHKKQLLDSAFYYFDRALIYSNDIIENKLKALKYLGNIYFYRGDLVKAEMAYNNALIQAKNSNLEKEFNNANYNLGFIKYNNKQYKEALIYFQRVDSMYNKKKSSNLDYINSNYYQAKIYGKFDDPEKAMEYSKIYLENFEKNNFEKYHDELEVNYKLSNSELEKEMLDLQKEYKFTVLMKKGMVLFFCILFVVLVVLLFVNYKRRKLAEQRVTAILEEYRSKPIDEKEEIVIDSNEIVFKDDEREVKEISSFNLENEKENEIMMKLKALDNKMFYLRPDFTQQEVARKIKTNTTYLSYVVNKNYNKSFSMYYNELRIAYVINEIISNSKYREYTTQAIAESAGFKNADSFASSFKKKTGVTPYQFINEIKKRELN